MLFFSDVGGGFEFHREGLFKYEELLGRIKKHVDDMELGLAAKRLVLVFGRGLQVLQLLRRGKFVGTDFGFINGLLTTSSSIGSTFFINYIIL